MDPGINIAIRTCFPKEEAGGNFFSEIHTVGSGRETTFRTTGNTTMCFFITFGDPNKCSFTLNEKLLPAGSHNTYVARPSDRFSYSGPMTLVVSGYSPTGTAGYEIHEEV